MKIALIISIIFIFHLVNLSQMFHNFTDMVEITCFLSPQVFFSLETHLEDEN